MTNIKLIYFSYSGNVRIFAKKLQRYALQQFLIRQTPKIITKEITKSTKPVDETSPFFVCVPSYGFNSKGEERITTPLSRYLEYHDNVSMCKGIIGNGDKAFAEYCSTARAYSKFFKLAFLSDFELQGTYSDIERIYTILTWSYSAK